MAAFRGEAEQDYEIARPNLTVAERKRRKQSSARNRRIELAALVILSCVKGILSNQSCARMTCRMVFAQLRPKADVLLDCH
jgi:hypothetical protein